jgi:hypothetical protein
MDRQIASLTVNVKDGIVAGAPVGSTLRLDGTQVDPNTPLRVNPGDHIAEAGAPQHEPARKAFSIGVGESKTLDLVLIPLVPTRTLSPEAPSTPTQEHERRYNAAFWAMAGLSAAFLVTGVITGIAALSDSHAYHDPHTSDADAAAVKSSGQVLRVVADSSFGVSIAAAAVAALIALRHVDSSPAKTQISFANGSTSLPTSLSAHF